MHVLNFGSHFKMFSCLVSSKCAMNWLQASRPDEERERGKEGARKQGHLRWVHSSAAYAYDGCFISTFRDGYVNLMMM